MPTGDRVVWSTADADPGRRPRDRHRTAGRPGAQKGARAPAQTPGIRPDTVYVERSTRGRGGKVVTLVTNHPGDDAGKAALLKELKTACGAGGTVRDGVIELQGDHRQAVVARLEARGLKVKSRGG